MEEMNYDIANALYLASEKLGKKYEEERETPLDKNFALTDSFVSEVLKGAMAKNNIEQSEFLKSGNKSVSSHFEKALLNTQEVINGLSSRLKKGEFAGSMTDNIEEEVKQVIDILKIRKKLLEISIIELKNKKIDSFGLYKDIQGLSETVNEIMANSYEEKLEKDIIVERFIQKCREENRRKRFIEAQRKEQARIEAETRQRNEEIENEVNQQLDYYKKQMAEQGSIKPQNIFPAKPPQRFAENIENNNHEKPVEVKTENIETQKPVEPVKVQEEPVVQQERKKVDFSSGRFTFK